MGGVAQLLRADPDTSIDLNRAFSEEALESTTSRDIIKVASLAKSADLVLDLHSSFGKSLPFAVIDQGVYAKSLV